jgi:pimeloyl-ACP methyl ester carboxylesterase
MVLMASLVRPESGVEHQERTLKPSLSLTPCEVSGVKVSAKCGKYKVFENRATKNGRKISLNIVVFPATGAERAADPFVYLAGGPGSGATEEAGDVAQAFAKVRERRDLVFVDQRGTGNSNPLNCDFFTPADPQSYFGDYFPLADVRKCREQLERNADLTLYTTPIAADDMDEVRAALGYERLNLFGASYGTRAALVYLKRHPDHVRTATLHGVAPTNQFMPRDFAQHTERALQGVLAECAADESCNKAFPNLSAEARAVREQLLKGPIEVEVRNPATGGRGDGETEGTGNASKHSKVKLSRDLAAEAIRYMLYAPIPATNIPRVLHSAAQGDFVPLAEAALMYRRGIVATGSNGMYLSVTCAEDVPWIKLGEGERIAANTFLGDYRVRQQRAACELWPRASIDADYGEPVRSSVPVLIFTGEWDPVTPPSNGEGVARYLTNSLHVVVPHGAHGLWGLEGIECLDRLNTEFIEMGSVKGLDASCVKNVKRKGWAVPKKQ